MYTWSDRNHISLITNQRSDTMKHVVSLFTMFLLATTLVILTGCSDKGDSPETQAKMKAIVEG